MKFFLILISILLFASACQNKSQTTKTGNPYHDISAINQDSSINVLIEIPSGTDAKYELNKETGIPEIEIINGIDRHIKYLPYPSNYGMIPGTILPKSLGGDGDPLDVILLGPALERGEIYKAYPIAILKLLDHGEQDDKLIAVGDNTVFQNIRSLPELKNQFPGILEIITIWFENYKEPGAMIADTVLDNEIAMKMLEDAVYAYDSIYLRNKSKK